MLDKFLLENMSETEVKNVVTKNDRKPPQTTANHQQTNTNHHKTLANDHKPLANGHKPPANDLKRP